MSILKQTKEITKAFLPQPVVERIQRLLGWLAIVKVRGLSLHLNFLDRYVLEDTIIPYFVERQEFQRVLFIGSDWYTKPYNRYFRSKEYWTIEIDPVKKKYGAKKHVVGSLLNLSEHFTSNYFDLIIYNGVFGYGIDTREATETSFQQCFQCLRSGGILVFGWNDILEFQAFSALEQCQSLQQFKPYVFSPLTTTQYLVADSPNRHRFNFYLKPLPQ